MNSINSIYNSFVKPISMADASIIGLITFVVSTTTTTTTTTTTP